jgi:hypothetical protein
VQTLRTNVFAEVRDADARIEFMAAVTRPSPKYGPIHAADDARREAEELLSQFTALYSNEALARMALRGMGLPALVVRRAPLGVRRALRPGRALSEDFQHDRLYGTVRAVNPFA